MQTGDDLNRNPLGFISEIIIDNLFSDNKIQTSCLT